MDALKFSVPKPCNENWDAMTPESQERFCTLCAKTVVDFTGMKAPEISDYLLANQSRKVCGRFEKTQLAQQPLRIEIPRNVLFSQTSFRNIFMLALFITMGITLLSCKNHNNEDVLMGDIAYIDTLTFNQRKFDTVYYSDVKDMFGNNQHLPKIIATDTMYINPGDDTNLEWVVMIRPGDSILTPPPPPLRETYKAPENLIEKAPVKK